MSTGPRSSPRKKLPPPTTTATWVPPAATSALCRASECTTSGSTPTWPPPNTSPDSFSSTRWYQIGSRPCDGGATSCSVTAAPLVVERGTRNPSSSALADLEMSELRDGHAGLVEDLL